MFRKRKEKVDARYADYLMEADEDFPYEVYEKMTKEPDFEETLDYFVSSFEPSVRGLYARSKFARRSFPRCTSPFPVWIRGSLRTWLRT